MTCLQPPALRGRTAPASTRVSEPPGPWAAGVEAVRRGATIATAEQIVETLAAADKILDY